MHQLGIAIRMPASKLLLTSYLLFLSRPFSRCISLILKWYREIEGELLDIFLYIGGIISYLGAI
jgi:hypothetical protein